MPPVQGADAGERVFSAERAAAVVRRVMPEPRAHPMGSPEAARVRDGLVAELERIGARVEVQRAWVRKGGDQFALVHNVVGHFPGTGEGREVLALAHYDSVAAGPGENDDLAGCAAWVEALRALPAGSSNVGIWVVFTDGEELGLYGAQAFAEKHPAMGTIGLVVNLEARGARGPSRLFESGMGNGPLMELYGDSVRYPSASSLSVEVYRRMPNDSDLTVFLERGLPGLNFAYIGDWAAYHAPLDLLERGGLRSLQHHGENILGVLRGIQERPEVLAAGAVAEDSVHVDVLGRGLLRYSEGVGWWLAVLGAGLVILAWLRFVRSGREAGHLALGVALWPLVVLAPVSLCFGVLSGLQVLTGTKMVFWSRHLPAALLALACFLLGWGVMVWATRRLAPRALCLANWMWQAGLGIWLAYEIPGAAVVFLPVALVLGLWIHCVPKKHWAWGSLVCGILCLVLWVPLHGALLDAFGRSHFVALVLPLCIPAAFLWPLVVDLRRGAFFGVVGTSLLALAFVFTVGALREPHTVERPGTLNLVWGAEGVQMRTGAFQIPSGTRELWQGELDAMDHREWIDSLTKPTIRWDSDGQGLHYRGRLKPGAGGQDLVVWWDGGGKPSALILGGEAFPFDGRQFRLRGVPPVGVEFEVELTEPGTGACRIRETVSGLSPQLQMWYQGLAGEWVPRGAGHRFSLNGLDG